MAGELAGRRVLVTGASSGLGVDFARELAARGAALVLVARRLDRLEELAAELKRAHGVEVECAGADLGDRAAVQGLFERVTAGGRAVDVLVNNAGFGVYGPYLEIPWEREHAMLELDVVTLAHLTKLFARPMVERRFGRILQVASIGAFQPTPTYAAYSAAKAFVVSFSEAIDFELAGTGVSCTVVSPGVTATEFLAVSGQKPTLYQRLLMMTSADVARAGIDAMIAGRRHVVPGLLNALGALTSRLAPRRLATWIAWMTMRNA